MRRQWLTWLLVVIAAAGIGLAVGYGVSRLSDGAQWMNDFAIVVGVEAGLVFVALYWFLSRETRWLATHKAR